MFFSEQAKRTLFNLPTQEKTSPIKCEIQRRKKSSKRQCTKTSRREWTKMSARKRSVEAKNVRRSILYIYIYIYIWNFSSTHFAVCYLGPRPLIQTNSEQTISDLLKLGTNTALGEFHASWSEISVSTNKM